MKKIIFAVFLFLNLMSGFAAARQALAERDVVVTPAPPRTQTARPVEVRSVTAQPAPVVAKPTVSLAPAVVKTPQPIEPKAAAVKTPSVKPATDVKKETSAPPASTSFFQGLLDRWFPKR